MTSGCLPCRSEQNLVDTFPGQYVNERNQVYWAYPCEEMGRLNWILIQCRSPSMRSSSHAHVLVMRRHAA